MSFRREKTPSGVSEVSVNKTESERKRNPLGWGGEEGIVERNGGDLVGGKNSGETKGTKRPHQDAGRAG